MPRIEVKSNDRVTVVGMTGSGKTFLVGYLVRTARRLVVLDPKGTLRGKWRLSEWTDETRERLLGGEPVRIRVGYPVETDGDWSDYLWDVYNAGNVLLVIDEMLGVVPSGKRPSSALIAIYTRGRELGIGAISCSQRSHWIPLEMLSESSWFFMFRLLLEEDRKRMAGMMGPMVQDPIPPSDPFGFWSYMTGWYDPIYTPQLEIVRPRAESGMVG